MIKTGSNEHSVKALREAEAVQKKQELKQLCIKLANERWGEEKVTSLSNQHKGLWFLSVQDSDGNVEKLALMKPIDRHILSYASTKITDEGLYAFLEACMRSCFIEGDQEILEDDDYFIPAANSFNAILEGKKATLLKR